MSSSANRFTLIFNGISLSQKINIEQIRYITKEESMLY